MKKAFTGLAVLALLTGIGFLWGEDQPPAFPLKLLVGAVRVENCFTARDPNEIINRSIRRDTGSILAHLEFDTGSGGPGDRRTAEQAREWNPVFATRTASWTDYIRLEVRRREGEIFSHQDLAVEWVSRTQRLQDRDHLRYFDKQESKGVISDGIRGTILIRLVRGGYFPDGGYVIHASYDTTGNTAGLARIKQSIESRLFRIEKPKTEQEALELDYQRAQECFLWHGDADVAVKRYEALLAKRPNSARVVQAIMQTRLHQGDHEQALIWARRYQDVFQRRLDPQWFTADEFKKAGWDLHREAYDYREPIRRLEERIAEKKWQERMNRK